MTFQGLWERIRVMRGEGNNREVSWSLEIVSQTGCELLLKICFSNLKRVDFQMSALGSQTVVDLFPVHYVIKSELLTQACQALDGPPPIKPSLPPVPVRSAIGCWLPHYAPAYPGLSALTPAHSPAQGPLILQSHCTAQLQGAPHPLQARCMQCMSR